VGTQFVLHSDAVLTSPYSTFSVGGTAICGVAGSRLLV
jgi:hypothetical protein